ncbi:hypothetical protein MKW98_024727 [Papaver atlanticum]|uniref:FRIGIDA-like protein n=1 Tax=Papaver atlanticum TaxID=357466 RepID=A0AAD4TB47_9MAGN|nr:hypothetical protein MKW98_027887 [Papaver atlanticum]KAI3946413.1 hypothetical protein MKW98_024727 [Papaver atlanticum]
MEDAPSVATLTDSTTTKMQQLQQAFGRFDDSGDQEKEFKNRASEAWELVEKKTAVDTKEHASLEKLQDSESDLTVEAKLPDMKVAAIDLEEVNKISNNEEMDSKGLHKYVSDNRKYSLMISADPARLVLDSLEPGGFLPHRSSNLGWEERLRTLGSPETCIMLMKCLAESFADTGQVLSLMVSIMILRNFRENLLEAPVLQLLATFDIARDFNEEEILKLIPTVSVVVKQLTFAVRKMAALLKSHLKEARETSSPTKPGKWKRISHGEYPVDPFQKWIFQLDIAKTDTKRVAEATYFYATVPDRYPPCNHKNMHYVYPGHTYTHPSSLLGAEAYNIPPNHGNY